MQMCLFQLRVTVIVEVLGWWLTILKITSYTYSHGRVISRNPPVPADKQIAHHPSHSEESAYYPSFWKSAYYPSSKFQPEIHQCS